MTQVSVLVVEDDAFTRSALCGALEKEGFQTPGAAGSAAEAITSYMKHKQQILLADLDLGSGPTGVELAWHLRQKNHDLALVFLTSYEDPRLHRQHRSPLPPGSIYLVKQELVGMQDISKALKLALESALSSNQKINTSEISSLTDVQIETLRLLAEGLSNAEIAKARFVSEKAVEQSIHKIAQLLEIGETGKNLRVLLSNEYLKSTGGKK